MTQTPEPPAPRSIMLEALTAEIEAFADQAGWDTPPTLFALVSTKLLAADPAAASLLSPDGSPLNPEDFAPEALTPIAQEELPEGPLDEALAQIGWPTEVL